ncbi:hypothetical protein F4777DRAFT_561114 [Nemania sp. FL0916]|nr:hypothetical protein F4777DRAFT_561114 [Nemania sp. FL0916]
MRVAKIFTGAAMAATAMAALSPLQIVDDLNNMTQVLQSLQVPAKNFGASHPTPIAAGTALSPEILAGLDEVYTIARTMLPQISGTPIANQKDSELVSGSMSDVFHEITTFFGNVFQNGKFQSLLEKIQQSLDASLGSHSNTATKHNKPAVRARQTTVEDITAVVLSFTSELLVADASDEEGDRQESEAPITVQDLLTTLLNLVSELLTESGTGGDDGEATVKDHQTSDILARETTFEDVLVEGLKFVAHRIRH